MNTETLAARRRTRATRATLATPATLAAIFSLVAFASNALAQSDPRIVVPLSEPNRPATLEVSLFNGSVTVGVHDGNEIVISTQDGRDDEPVRPDREGLRRIPNTSLGLTAEEKNNTVSISVDWNRRGMDLDILVPRQTSVHARTVNGGDLRISGVAGNHELANVNGSIEAADIAGSLVASTTNGDVNVGFREITPNKAMSFTSFNGDIEVAFPRGLSADLRVNAGRGEVLTDFDFEVQPQTSVVDRGGEAGRYRVRLEREVRAVVGGGGPEMQFKTFNGDIVIRQR
jgi:hypothetical protein